MQSLSPNAAAPERFTLLNAAGAQPHQAANDDESLLGRVMLQGPVASIWHTQQSLVVPRSYRRFENFEQVCAQFAQQGWPVTVRQTGGGLVPQGPGIVNLSLAYGVQGPPMQHSEAGYLLICELLADALRSIGIEAFPAAVEGSFCDGRYNLAVRQAGRLVKIAGTAQSWRRAPGTPDTHLGLVHALVLIDVDTAMVTEMANAFESALGNGQPYLADKVIAAAELLDRPPALQNRFEQALSHVVTRACPSLPSPAASISGAQNAKRRTSSRLME